MAEYALTRLAVGVGVVMLATLVLLGVCPARRGGAQPLPLPLPLPQPLPKPATVAAVPVVPLVFPVAGKAGWRDTFQAPRSGGRKHQGQDLMAPRMQPLLAAFDGRITGKYPNRGTAGNYLVLTGDNGASATYMHINNDTPGTDDGKGGVEHAFAPGIEVGTRVCAGQLIAWCGDSGNAETTAPHLHFELRLNGATINAAPSLRAAAHLDAPVNISPVFFFEDGEFLRIKPQGRPATADPLVPLSAQFTDEFWQTRLNIARKIVSHCPPAPVVSTPAETADPCLRNADRCANGDPATLQAMARDWQQTVQSRMSLIGSIEPTQPNAPETVFDTTLAFARWTQRMFLCQGETRYLDVYERTLYNSLLGGIGGDGKAFQGAMPLRAGDDMTCASWQDAPACAGQLLRAVQGAGDTVYAQNGNQFFVNRYAGSMTRFTTNGNTVTVKQDTDFPWTGTARITFGTAKPTYFVLLLRVPGWVLDRTWNGARYLDYRNQRYTVAINGKPIEVELSRLGYLIIPRKWVSGDVVELALPMTERRVQSYISVDDRPAVAVERGPLVYCVESIDHPVPLDALALPDDVPLSAAVDPAVLPGATVIRAAIPGTENSLTCIPYYAWASRGKSAMTVWLPRSTRPAPPLTFRCLLIIKPTAELRLRGMLPVQGLLNMAELETVSTVFNEDFPRALAALAPEWMRVETQAVVSTSSLTTLAVREQCGYLEPADIADDLDDFAPRGAFDTVFVYYAHNDAGSGYVLPCATGDAVLDVHGAGFVAIPAQPVTPDWRPRLAQQFAEGWQRHLTGWYANRGLRLPDNSLRGLGADARRMGTPRADAQRQPQPEPLTPRVVETAPEWQALCASTATPQFCTTARIAQATPLLDKKKPEEGWEIAAQSGGRDAAIFGASGTQRLPTLRLLAAKPDSIQAVIRCTVPPNIPYVLVGYVMADNIHGAGTLAVTGNARPSTFTGSNTWQYIALPLHSDARGEVEVTARLGQPDQLATGAIYFSRLYLVPVR